MVKLTIKEHLLELRQRAFKIIIFFLISFTVSWFYKDDILNLLIKPLAVLTSNDAKIIYTGLAEGFLTNIKLVSLVAFLSSVPVILWQVFAFLKSGLHEFERKILRIIFLGAFLLIWAGTLFVIKFAMPRAFTFFLSFENKNLLMPIELQARFAEYINLITQLILGFSAAFLTPLLLIILHLLQLISTAALKKSRKIAIVIIFLLAAILTPPDIASQFMLALPLILLYEIVIIICNFIDKNDDRYKVD